MNRRRVAAILVTATLTAVGALSLSPASSSAGPTTPPDPAQNCTRPLPERVGGWLCTDGDRPGAPFGKPGKPSGDSGATMLEADTESLTESLTEGEDTSAPSVEEGVTGDGIAGRCLVAIGCYHILNTAKTAADFIGTKGYYGYGGKTLGSVKVDVKDTFEGKWTRSNFQTALFSKASHTIWWRTERLYVSGTCTGGCQMDPRYYKDSSYFVVGPGGGTVSFNNVYTWGDTAYATTSHYIDFKDYTYPGRWWVRVKSVKAKKNTLNTAYFYEGTLDDPALVSSPVSSGYIG